ncbi:MAG TPA: 3D-(3,5/4)-trihydroxycyclohexane-1,2-dione acylhydrolase (decyclizing) [Egibacteraceae bacterium]|nr:3D-(3,5/4)-trihydroxycyclohexane-1,2-dione acylhydrolase (decyclizing) [Egibacteraceae bacterium]
MTARRLTTAQALVEFLIAQHVERDGRVRRFFDGCFGIFGHGNVAGVGQALQQAGDRLRYYQSRNEQAMVHAAAGYARMRNRLGALACTTSVGPGATNMVTAAAGATINRLPVLLLPGDVFASRLPRPVLQQLERPGDPDVSVNDCFRPVSRYFDRINRPEQLIWSAVEAMRVLTDPAETGAVTLALPQDVQAEAYDFPADLFAERVWRVPRPLPEAGALDRAVVLLRSARRPLIIAGGGVIYSEAAAALRGLVDATGIPVAETQAGKGSLPYDHPSNLGAAGATGTPGAAEIARGADVVLGVGTRWSDFTTGSQALFANPSVRFVNVNIAAFDAHKFAGEALVGDARATLGALSAQLAGYDVEADYRARARELAAAWDEQVSQLYTLGHSPLPAQSEVIGAVNEAAGPRDVVVCAAGSMPGDLHRLWRARDPKAYHVEYGYSCMGYEIAGGLGVKMADPSREVYVMVGDGSYLMMAQELVTAVQEGVKLIVVLVDNQGYASIGSLSESLGSGGFGTRYRYRDADGALEGDVLPVDLAANAASLGAVVHRAETLAQLREALKAAREETRTTVVCIRTDPSAPAPGSGVWWDVPVAEVSDMPAVQAARSEYETQRRAQRHFL